jgi:hypothetical protein
MFNALAAASAVLLLYMALTVWQDMLMNPHPDNPFTTEIGVWSGGYGWVPIWVIICAALPLPLIWIATRILVKTRPRRGFCSACGYDLRATPDRCPECGKIVEKLI